MGGARPKATVHAVDGSLWIAKFPSKHDDNNTGAWEKVVHDLDKMCGLNVPESSLETFFKLGSTFLVKRFDRDGDRRIHFASAMTMLGKVNGASADDGTSYLELVSFLKSNGAAPKMDLMGFGNVLCSIWPYPILMITCVTTVLSLPRPVGDCLLYMM